MAVNSEGIHGTRPWKICGEGPSVEGTIRDTSVFKLMPPIPDTSPGATRSSGRRDSGSKPYTAQDVRFTTKGSALYAFVLGRPSEPRVQITSLATPRPSSGSQGGGRVATRPRRQTRMVANRRRIIGEAAGAIAQRTRDHAEDRRSRRRVKIATE